MRKELNETAVIEVEDSLLKVARVKLSNGRVELEDFFVLDYANLNDAIASLIKSGKISVKTPCIISLGSGLATVKKITLPPIPKNELKEALSWAVHEELPFSLDKATFQSTVIAEKKEVDGSIKQDMLVFIAENALVDKYTQALKNLGIIAEAIFYSPQSLSNLISKSDQFSWDKCNAIVDIGYNATNISFLKNKQLVFSRNVSVGAKHIIESIKGTFMAHEGKVEVSLEDAKRIAFSANMFPGKSDTLIDGKIPQNQLLAKVRSVFEDLAQEISRSLVYFKVNSKEDILDTLYVSGYGLRIDGIEDFLREFLGLKVERISVFSGVAASDELMKDKDIIMQGFNCIASAANLNSPIDFLPEDLRLRKRHVLESFILKVCMAALFIIFLFSVSLSNLSLTKYKSELHKRKLQAQELKKINEVFDKIASLENLIRVVSIDRIPFSWSMKELSNIVPVNITFDDFIYDGAKKKMKAQGRIKSQGANEQASLAEFLDAIDASLLFKGATLISSQKKGQENEFSFVIEFSLEDVKGDFYGRTKN